MIVVDTNVVAYAYIQGDSTKLAHKVREADPQWRLPTLWRHEFLNVLSVYVVQGGCRLEQALILWKSAVGNLGPCEHIVNMTAALKMACEYKIAAYDAQFIVLARTLGVLCVTEDASLLKKFPGTAVSMEDFCRKG